MPTYDYKCPNCGVIREVPCKINENPSLYHCGYQLMKKQIKEKVNHPQHYHADSGIEVIDAIELWQLGFHLGNVVKYVSRSNLKGNKLEDLQKAQWYLNRAISKLSK